MASISANGARGHHNFTLNVWENSINQTNNSSNVGWSLVLSPVQTGWDWNISGVNWSVSINGVNYSGTIPSYDGRSSVTIASSSLDVGHDNYGDKQIGFNFSINDTRGASYTPGSCSASGTMWLTHIDRWAIVTSAVDFNDEGTPTMTFVNNAGYPMSAWLEVNPVGEHLCIRENIQNTGTYTWQLTNEERQQLRQKCTSNSAIIRYGLYSNIGGTLYASYVDKIFTIVNGNPVFEDFEYEDTNTAVTTITGDNQVLVKGISTLQATIPIADKMTALKEATGKNYVATIGAINQSENYSDENDVVFNLGAIDNAGVQRLNIRAYDSRNNSTLVYKDITVYDYAKPIVNFTAERLNNFENQTTLKINGSFSSLVINNVEKNTIQSVQYRYKEKDSQTWGNWVSAIFTLNNNEYLCNDIIISLDNTKAFDIEVKTVDNLSNNTANTSIDVGKSIFFISSNEKKCYINDERVLVESDLENYDKYSSVETAIGSHVNGEIIYRKTIYISSFPNSTTQNYSTGISNIDIIVDIKGFAQPRSGTGFPINVSRPESPGDMIGVWVENNNIRVAVGNVDRSGYYGYITLEYTKTNNN